MTTSEFCHWLIGYIHTHTTPKHLNKERVELIRETLKKTLKTEQLKSNEPIVITGPKDLPPWWSSTDIRATDE